MLKDNYIFINIIITFLLIIFLSRIADKFLLIDKPGPRKIHKTDVPLVGGIAIFISIFFFLDVFNFDIWFKNLIYVGFIILMLGIADDIFNLNQYLRLLVQSVCAFILLHQGIKITSFGEYSYIPNLNIISLSSIITILAVIIYINALNFIDGIDGLATSQSILTILFLIIFLNFELDNPALFFLKIILTTLVVFLLFNLDFKFIKLIFLGDSGSTLIGFLIAWLLIYYSSSTINFIHPGLVLYFIALPIFDFLFVFYFRLINRLNPLKSDNYHFHHTLLKLGYNKYQILIISILVSSLIFITGLLIYYTAIKDFLILCILFYIFIYFIIMYKLQKKLYTKILK